MSGSDGLTGAVVRVLWTPAAFDHIQDLHARVLGVPAHDEEARRVAYADLSDAICATLGQLAATGAGAAGEVLRSAVVAANRRGVDGVESIFLSAFLSAMGAGITADVGNAAAVWLTRPFPDRLAGGARRVPLLDTARLAIGSVSASELAFAVQASAGSAGALAERLRHLVGEPAGEEALDIDDPTLEPVARACADAYTTTTTAGRLLEASLLEPALAGELEGVLDTNPKVWRGPSSQLQSGKTLALAVGAVGTAADAGASDPGPIPAGLMPRPRRSPGTITPTDPAAPRTRLIPARVTKEPPTWLTVTGRTAELNPPLALRPGPGPGASSPDRAGSRRGSDVRRGAPIRVPDTSVFVVVGGTPTDALTGAPVHPITGQPIGPSPGELGAGELAEAILVAAKELDVDVRTATVADVAERLLSAEAGPDR